MSQSSYCKLFNKSRSLHTLQYLESPISHRRLMTFARTARRLFSTSSWRLGALSELGPSSGSTKQQTRVGRGPGSGRGKTSGRGQKGQKARASVKPWFEGGQTPITKLFPKVGFRSKIPKPATLNLDTIQQLINSGRIDPSKPVTMRELYRSRALGANARHGIKILGGGSDSFMSKLTISATRATPQAINKIESLGGKFTAEYYNSLGIRALTRPEAVLKKFARLPLRARPSDRRNIEFYRDPSSRGYLVGAPNPPQVKKTVRTVRTTESPLVARLHELEKNDTSIAVADGFTRNEALSSE